MLSERRRKINPESHHLNVESKKYNQIVNKTKKKKKEKDSQIEQTSGYHSGEREVGRAIQG